MTLSVSFGLYVASRRPLAFGLEGRKTPGTRAALRMDVGLYMGIISCPLPKSSGPTRNIDRSSYQKRLLAHAEDTAVSNSSW